MSSQISRKDFLKGLGAAAVAAGLGTYAGCSQKERSAAPAASAVASADGTGKYKPGTYTASAKGIASDVTVTMTFDETSITDVKVDASGETPDIGGKAADTLAQSILDAQGIDIDMVSGATVTSTAALKAAADCIQQAGGTAVVNTSSNEKPANEDWLGEAPDLSEADCTETIETEAVVAGLGTGGWPAAMTLAENGVKTVVIEMGEKPSNIKEDIAAINSRYQTEGLKDFPQLAIDKVEIINEIARYGSGYVDYDLIRTWADNSGELVDWVGGILEDSGKYFVQWEAGAGDASDPSRYKAFATSHSPHKVDDSDKDLNTSKVFTAYVEQFNDVEFRFSTKLVRLLQDDNGKVTGLIAQDQNDQHYICIKASKGVIVSTGSYATNTEMLKALQPETLKMKTNVPIGSKGDGSGIKAMLWAGANMDCTHESMMFNRGSVLPTETAGYETNGAWFWFGEQPFLKVNLNGDRFANEAAPYEFMLHSMYMQPNHTYCTIWDSNAKQYSEQFQAVGCYRLFPWDNGAIPNHYFDQTWSDMMEGENSLLAKGYVVQADTIEELGEKLNIPADELVKTVEHYNELCANGEDTDYGKDKHKLTPIDQGPFYGARTCAWHLTTMDGCRINTNMQVIREDGTPIEGLYATGDCTGGFFANNYPNLVVGLACGRTMTFGRRAAKVIAGK